MAQRVNITAAVWTAGFHWWRFGNKKRTQNVSEYMLVLALCLVRSCYAVVRVKPVPLMSSPMPSPLHYHATDTRMSSLMDSVQLLLLVACDAEEDGVR